MLTKKEIRKTLKQKRKDYPSQLEASEDIRKHIAQFIKTHNINKIGFFYALDDEVNITPLAWEMLLEGKKIFFPKVIDGNIVFCEVFSMKDFSIGAYEIMEPITKHHEVHLDLILIPGLGFNENKYRLGYGGGYYDKYLSSRKNLETMGCFFSIQKAQFPIDEWDIMLKYIVTENGVES